MGMPVRGRLVHMLSNFLMRLGYAGALPPVGRGKIGRKDAMISSWSDLGIIAALAWHVDEVAVGFRGTRRERDLVVRFTLSAGVWT